MTSASTAGGSLAISFEPDDVKKRSPLQDEVLQIISQRGAFRNINGRLLREELSRPTAASADHLLELDAGDDSDEDESLQARQEKLFASRNEFIQKLSSAQNDVLSALDFVSLLLSSHSVVAQTSMSAVLKGLVPPKTLDGRIVQVNDLPPKIRQSRQAASQGWKSESFKTTSARLANTSARLDEETQRQGRYWEQIAHLKARGWPISRLPNDSRAIGVHFGFPESSPLFRNRALALLQQDDAGRLNLDSRVTSRNTTRLRLAICRRGVETGSSGLSNIDSQRGDGIHSELVEARDAIFEEELYHEISREARAIASQGVRTRLNAVEIDISDDYQVQVINESANSSSHPARPGKDDVLAGIVFLSMRLLLLAEHRRGHERRTKPPPPMTLTPRPTPEYAILRPIIARLRHQANLFRITHILSVFVQPLQSCGILCELATSSSQPGTEARVTSSMSSLRGIVGSKVSLLLDKNSMVSVEVDTYLGPPLYGSMYSVSAASGDVKHLHTAATPSLTEVVSLIRDGLTLLINRSIQTWTGSNGNGSKDVLWTLTRPHSGEFVVSKDLRTLAKVMVETKPGRIALHVQHSGTSANRSVLKEIYMWQANGLHRPSPGEGISASTESLKDIIDSLSQSLQSGSNV